MQGSMTFSPGGVGAILILSLTLGACASSGGQGAVTPSAQITEDKRFAVGDVTVRATSSKPAGIDVKALMTQSLNEALTDAGSKWSGAPTQDHANINVVVTNYQPGNAFGRWLMPGLGATVLAVEGSVTDSDGSTLATIRDERGVYAGGAYSIGAWSYIFDIVAKDIVTGLDRRTKGDAFVVEVATWLKRDFTAREAETKQTFRLVGVQDARREKGRIGERTAAFGVSMGNVYFYRSVPDYVEEMVATDLQAAGHTVTKTGAGVPLTVTIERFWATTETTALYWDVVANVELSVSVGDRKAKFSCRNDERTYVWPSETLFNSVVDGCLVDLMRDFRTDAIWRGRQPAT